MKHASVKHVTKSKYFQGEVMVCKNCSRMEKSDPHVSSDWTVVELDGIAFYYCPVCFIGERYLNPHSRPGESL